MWKKETVKRAAKELSHALYRRPHIRRKNVSISILERRILGVGDIYGNISCGKRVL